MLAGVKRKQVNVTMQMKSDALKKVDTGEIVNEMAAYLNVR